MLTKLLLSQISKKPDVSNQNSEIKNGFVENKAMDTPEKRSAMALICLKLSDMVISDDPFGAKMSVFDAYVKAKRSFISQEEDFFV